MILKIKYKERQLKFYLRRHSDFSSFYQVFVEKSYPNLLNKITKGDVVIDAGANIGIFTVISSILVGNDGCVLAIEPDPENLSILKKNMELNNLKNIKIINKALYKESGSNKKFYQNGVMSKIITCETQNETAYIDVETITFDDLISQTGIRPNILKMDIEGGEKFALLYAKNMINTLNYLEAEIHSKEDWDELQKYSNYFSFKREAIESMHNVFSFGIKHPLKILKLEYYNRFRTTKRIVSSMTNNIHLEYPIIIYGESLRQHELNSNRDDLK